MTTLKKLGKQLRETRKVQKLTLQDAAKKLNISYATLWKIETGKLLKARPRIHETIQNFVLGEPVSTPITRTTKPTDFVKLSRSIQKLNLAMKEFIKETDESALLR